MRGRGMELDREARRRELLEEDERSRSRHERRWLKSVAPPPLSQQDPRAADALHRVHPGSLGARLEPTREESDFARSFDAWWAGSSYRSATEDRRDRPVDDRVAPKWPEQEQAQTGQTNVVTSSIPPRASAASPVSSRPVETSVRDSTAAWRSLKLASNVQESAARYETRLGTSPRPEPRKYGFSPGLESDRYETRSPDLRAATEEKRYVSSVASRSPPASMKSTGSGKEDRRYLRATTAQSPRSDDKMHAGTIHQLRPASRTQAGVRRTGWVDSTRSADVSTVERTPRQTIPTTEASFAERQRTSPEMWGYRPEQLQRTPVKEPLRTEPRSEPRPEAARPHASTPLSARLSDLERRQREIERRQRAEGGQHVAVEGRRSASAGADPSGRKEVAAAVSVRERTSRRTEQPSDTATKAVAAAYHANIVPAQIPVENNIKVAEPEPAKSKKRARDEIAHFDWTPGQMLGQYCVKRLLGDGTFGRVLECVPSSNSKSKAPVAIKVVRDVKKYVEAAKIEAQVLRQVRQLAPESGTVQLLDTFMEGTHFCLVFEPLGSSLFDLLKANKYRGFFMADIQRFVYQILRALHSIHKIRLTHTDLKPENVLLVDSRTTTVEFPRGKAGDKVRRPTNSNVKLIDFGGSTFSHEHHSTVINTRQYRAPEVTLGNGWTESSDLWSAGCLAAELYSGRMLFPTHENLEHLAMMEASVEPIPGWMCQNASPAGAKYTEGERIAWPGVAPVESRTAVQQCRRLEDLPLSRHASFGQFLRQTLRTCSRKRPSARQLCKSDFFAQTQTE